MYLGVPLLMVEVNTVPRSTSTVSRDRILYPTVSRGTILYTGVPVLSIEVQYCIQEYPAVSSGTILYPGVPLQTVELEYCTQLSA